MSAPVFETFGCRLNAYETEAMRKLAGDAGTRNCVVVNTCAVTAEAVRQARQRIRRLRQEHPDAKLIVTGCAAQTDPASFGAMPEVDHVIGNLEKMQPAAWSGLGTQDAPRIQVEDIMTARETAGHLIDGFGTRARAYVQIQNGCDHRCTFCIIPFGRGNARSTPAGVVVDQIRRLVDRGYHEIVLTGVDLTSWGGDLPGQPPLGNLVQRILRLVPDLPRLRLSSIDSVEADADLIDAITGSDRVMPHLHLSLQAGDNMILKRMKRRHSREDAITLCADLKARRPDIVFGADIIAGFPTETDAMFANSLALIEDCNLTWLHVFPFSPREGTPAARMPQVNRQTVKSRAAELRAAGSRSRQAYLDSRTGQVEIILVETARRGRTEGFAPVDFTTDQPVGHIVSARITGSNNGRLITES